MIKKHKPHLNIGPGAFIREELEARGWRQEDLAEVLGMSLKSVNQLIKNKQAVTVETAQLLSKAFGQSPQYWLALDANYRLQLRQDKKRSQRVGLRAKIFKYMPIKEMIRKGWLRNYANTCVLEEEIRWFWQRRNLDFEWMERASMPNLRKSSVYTHFNLYYAYAWFNMAKRCAELYSVPKYSERKLKKLTTDFASYTLRKDGARKFLRDLNEAGVKFLVLSHLQRTYLDGAAFRDRANPVVVYTKRYDRVDNFWFTVAHEIAHILLHIRKQGDYFIDDLQVIITKKEKQANEHALGMIRANRIKEYFADIDTYISEYRVNDCAEEVGVSPALVVGVLQYEKKLSHRNLNRLKENVSDKIPKKYCAERNLSKLRKMD